MADGRLRGIDVSHNNGVVDWARVVRAGIDFAFAKATEGGDASKPWYTDSMFATNWAAMKTAGITRGAYHFIGLPLASTPRASWNDDLHSQIDHFLETVGPLDDGDLLPVLDLEDGDSPMRWQQLFSTDLAAAKAIVRELIEYTTSQLGQAPILYTGSFWWNQLKDPDSSEMPFGDCPLWFAQYPRVHRPMPLPGPAGTTDLGEVSSFDEYNATLSGQRPLHIPKVWGGPAAPKWNIWQFTSFGKVPGLTGFVDLDVLNGVEDDLAKLTVGGGS